MILVALGPGSAGPQIRHAGVVPERSVARRVSPSPPRAGAADATSGLPASGRRRTPGLRREEVATLAGVSIDYLVRLEQGRDVNPSAGVLAGLASALRLDDDERMHLFKLAAISGSRELCPAARAAAVEIAAIGPPVARSARSDAGLRARSRPAMCWRRTGRGRRSCDRSACSTARTRTSFGTCSWTPAPRTSTRTGATSPTVRSPRCGRPACALDRASPSTR